MGVWLSFKVLVVGVLGSRLLLRWWWLWGAGWGCLVGEDETSVIPEALAPNGCDEPRGNRPGGNEEETDGRSKAEEEEEKGHDGVVEVVGEEVGGQGQRA